VSAGWMQKSPGHQLGNSTAWGGRAIGGLSYPDGRQSRHDLRGRSLRLQSRPHVRLSSRFRDDGWPVKDFPCSNPGKIWTGRSMSSSLPASTKWKKQTTWLGSGQFGKMDATSGSRRQCVFLSKNKDVGHGMRDVTERNDLEEQFRHWALVDGLKWGYLEEPQPPPHPPLRCGILCRYRFHNELAYPKRGISPPAFSGREETLHLVMPPRQPLCESFGDSSETTNYAKGRRYDPIERHRTKQQPGR